MGLSTAEETLATIGFSAKTAACLASFSRLTDSEKNLARVSTIAEIFPLEFGNVAAVDSSVEYKQLRSKHWSKNCYLSPKVILSPTTAHQVAAILAICRVLGAKFSIRGGGHLQNPGFSSNDGGVVVNLSNFSSIVPSEDRFMVDVGLGLTWLEVYRALDVYGLAVTGGRMPQVGVPGLLLGGGLSFQVSKYGFSCTGVVQYEVVLADSSIVYANEVTNEDLFWALKGGFSNFGIVTGVKMATVPNTIWAEARVYSSSESETLLEALMEYHAMIENSNKAVLYFHIVDNSILLVLSYCDLVETPSVFNCFSKIPYIKKVIEPRYWSILEIIQRIGNVLNTTPMLHEMRTMSSLPDLEVYKAADECRKLKMIELKGVDGLGFTLSFQPIPAAAVQVSQARGGNSMGVEPKSQQWLLIMADWNNVNDEDIVRDACRLIIEAAETTAKRNGTYLPFCYSNYASRDQNPLKNYGSDNLVRLKEIATRYDPHEVFQTLQHGGWLLSRTDE